MIAAARIGMKDLLSHLGLALLMVGVVAVSLLSFLVLQGFRAGLQADFPGINHSYLVAIRTGSLGELYGSRLPPAVGAQLRARQEPLVVAEIHTIVGTSVENALLLKGIPLESYAQVEDFSMVAGQPLQAGDAPRQAMLGIKLAQARKASPGSTISLRGRDFTVKGIFEVGTYADEEAWISLTDAQALLGWGSDVSFYILSAQGSFHPGDQLPGEVSITLRGETGAQIIAEWQPLFDLIGVVTNTLALAATVALANVLWRLAWLRRHDLAILRTVGFGQASLAAYLAVQGAAVTAAGWGLGLAMAYLIAALTRVKAAGFTVSPVYDMQVLAGSALLAALITLVGALLPAWWLSRFNLVKLLRVE